jgi:CDP-glucose 4,6-dehydratase
MNFWQGRKVLVTGHTGFKGSWLSLWLQTLGADLMGFALQPPTKSNLFTLANVADGMHSIIGDVRNFTEIQTAIKKFQPEIVIHMAAQALVRHSYKEPVETYATNVMGTVHLLEAIRQVDSVRTVVNVTTDKCYENKEWHWGYRENDRLGGHDPYSNSKACSELVTSAYRSSYFYARQIGLASARAGNVIGGGDWAADRLVPDIIRACMDGRPVSIRNPHSLRPWQHVLEPLQGYLLLAEKLHQTPDVYADSWNFGPEENDVKPVSWIADHIVKLWQNGASWIQDGGADLHEATYLKLDCAKARTLLGWQSQFTLEKALAETVTWYRAYQAQSNMRDSSLAQIKNYMGNKAHAPLTEKSI